MRRVDKTGQMTIKCINLELCGAGEPRLCMDRDLTTGFATYKCMTCGGGKKIDGDRCI